MTFLGEDSGYVVRSQSHMTRKSVKSLRTISLVSLVPLLVATGCQNKVDVEADPEPTVETAPPAPEKESVEEAPKEKGPIVEAFEVVPLQHASMLLKWEDFVVAVDPTQGALDAHEGDEPKADLILVTDIHGDHLDTDAIAKLRKEGGVVVAPQAVVDKVGGDIPDPTILANGETKALFEGGVEVTGVAMYNMQRKREDSGEPYHIKGRGNGYVLTRGDERIYISGDTECIPEMKALTDIDVAFVCMNLPYTMTPEEAAVCIAEFAPTKLYPYHHRGQNPKKLDTLLAGANVEVELLDWYPETDDPTGASPAK